MIPTSTRRLTVELQTRMRLKRRIAEAAKRVADTCDCPVCQLRRAVQAGEVEISIVGGEARADHKPEARMAAGGKAY